MSMNLMAVDMTDRKFGRTVRLLDAGVPAEKDNGLFESSVSRRFQKKFDELFDEWISSDLSKLKLVKILIAGLCLDDRLPMIGAVGVNASGHKRPLSIVEGATENAAAVQTLLDDLTGRGLDPEDNCLFIVDGPKELSEVLRRTFGSDILIRCR